MNNKVSEIINDDSIALKVFTLGIFNFECDNKGTINIGLINEKRINNFIDSRNLTEEFKNFVDDFFSMCNKHIYEPINPCTIDKIAHDYYILENNYNQSSNLLSIVFGAGSYSLNLVGRDHLGMAIKATNAVIELDGHDVSTAIYKDPKTDSSKKSLKGRIKVNDDLTYTYNVSLDESNTGLLTDVYVDGQFKKLPNVFEIRKKMWE